MTIVAISAVKTAIGRSRHAAREARAGRCCRSENRDVRLATFRDFRGDARRRSASRVGLDATFAARDARDSRNGACGSVGRRGGGRRTSCRTRCHGTGVYDGMSEGDAVMWEKQSVDAQPTSSRSTFSRKLSRTTGCRSSPPPNFSKVQRSRARCGFRLFRFDSYAYQLRSHRTFRRNHRGNHLVSQQFRPFGVPKGREGLRELQTRALCEKSYAHSVPKKPENVDSRLVSEGKIASDRTLALFPRSVGCERERFRRSTKSRARATVSERGRSRLFARGHENGTKRR